MCVVTSILSSMCVRTHHSVIPLYMDVYVLINGSLQGSARLSVLLFASGCGYVLTSATMATCGKPAHAWPPSTAEPAICPGTRGQTTSISVLQ